MTPDAGRGGRGAALCRDAGGRASAASASSTTCTTTATASPMPTLAEMAERIAAAAARDRHRPDAAAGVLRPRRLRRRRRPTRPAPLHQRSRPLCPAARGEPRGGRRPARMRVVGVAPHSLRAVTPDELAAVVALAGAGPIHIHVAEQVKEVEDCLAWSGARPVEWLLDHAPVDERWCLIHATHMTEAETAAMAAAGAVAGLCPITEANLGDGMFDAPPLHRRRRPLRRRLGFQRPDRRRRRAAPARIFAAPRPPRPQRDGLAWRIHRPHAVRARPCRAGPPRSAARSPR